MKTKVIRDCDEIYIALKHSNTREVNRRIYFWGSGFQITNITVTFFPGEVAIENKIYGRRKKKEEEQ